MVKIRWNEEALNDIDEIAEYIAADSIVYASIQVEKIFNRVEILKKVIKSGKVVEELNEQNIRELIEGNYRIIYEIISEKHIEVLCVLHGKRLLKNHPKFKKEM
jgi:plasmid stabilization system protein ParE